MHLEELDNSIFSRRDQAQFTSNGFLSTKQESVYNTITIKLVSLLSTRCAENLRRDNDESKASDADNIVKEQFAIKVLKLDKLLKNLESLRSRDFSSSNIS